MRTEGTDSAAICTVELTPLDNAPAPAQCRLTVKNGCTAYFTGLGFDAPGDYRYSVAELKGSAANTSYDAGVYTVTVRVTSRKDGTPVSYTHLAALVMDALLDDPEPPAVPWVRGRPAAHP